MMTTPLRNVLLFSGLLTLVAACHQPSGELIGPDPTNGIDVDLGFSSEPFRGPGPQFGATVTQTKAPPPISGGTLTVLADGHTAIASDPDRDAIYAVDLTTQQKLATITLSEDDEPGRAVEDTHGRVHVLLRRGGAVVTLLKSDWSALTRRDVCTTPRGIAADPTVDQIYVACEDGTLATLPGALGTPTRVLHLDRDLRDIVVRGDSLYVSRFHSAELLNVRVSDGTITARTTPAAITPVVGSRAGQYFGPEAAWRLAVGPLDQQVYMLHQRAFNGVISTTQPGGYGSAGDPCSGSIVHAAITQVAPG